MSKSINKIRLGVLTSGGDAPGMNAAVRSVVRTALEAGARVFAIYEGYRGMIEGEDKIVSMQWGDVGGILQLGGTVIGSARCDNFHTKEGRLIAVQNLVQNGIDRLVVIGGDGSLTGATRLRNEWSELLQELVKQGKITEELAAAHPFLAIAGVVGSIDNDMYGTDLTIGADTALHRITDAVDAISSTAASHQRAFVVEVMGRNCGYLAMKGAIASGADYVFIPESPPETDEWEERMCEILSEGLQSGRRDSIVMLAEGACDRNGNPITCEQIRKVLEERMGEDARITVLGHVQRGGAPSARDRIISTLMGAEAAKAVLEATNSSEPVMIGICNNKIERLPLLDCVAKTQELTQAIKSGDFQKAMDLRGDTFKESLKSLRTLVRAFPHPVEPGKKPIRFAVMTPGSPSPGMNTAVRATVRLGLDHGHIPIGISRGFRGLINGQLAEMDWGSVKGLVSQGGSDLGTSRKLPKTSDYYTIARNLEQHNVEALVLIGGWTGYEAALKLYEERRHFPAFNIPIICVPASINNSLPGSEFSIGADTALNSIIDAVDKIKQSAVASNRCFIIEVMGRRCGYLALSSALASGAERVYLHEEGVSLADLQRDIDLLVEGFSKGKRLGILVRNEHAHPLYTADFLSKLFEEEGEDLFDVRISVLGHLQQGGDPSPYDRIMATRMASGVINLLEKEFQTPFRDALAVCMGIEGEYMKMTNLYEIPNIFDMENQRPYEQWWMNLRPLARMLAQPYPNFVER